MLSKIKNFILIDKNVGYQIYRSIKPEEAGIVALNIRFKGMHQGKRCFILGNGPSLKDEDLSVLQDEYTFTVNQFSRYPDFKKVKTNYHFWADPAFFEIDPSRPEDKELLDVMKNIAIDNEDIECFFPIQQKHFVEKYSLEKCFKINYFRSYGPLKSRRGEIGDLSRSISGYGTVVQYAIESAIYMGFSRVYILGCDNTDLITTIRSALKKNDKEDYAYEVTENEKRRMEALLIRHPLEEYVKSYLSTLIDYKLLYKICERKGIVLMNCSSTTVIDSIPRIRLEEVMKENEVSL